MAKLWSYDLGLSPKEPDIKTALGPDVSLSDYHNFSVNPSVALFTDVIESIGAIEDLGKLLIEIKYDDSMELSDKSTTDFVQISNISFCDRKTQSVIQSSTSIRYFSLYLINQALHSSTLYKRYESSLFWKDDECICEVILNMHNVINALTEQSNVLVSQEEALSKAMKTDIIIFFSISIPIVFAAFIIPFIIGVVKVNLEFKQIFDVLNLLPIKIYKDASKPIAMFQNDFEQNQEGVSQVEKKSCQKIAILIPAIISSIVIVGSLIGVCFLIFDVNNKFYVIVKWLEIGSGRTPLLIETVTNAIYAGIYGYLGDTDYTTLVYHLQSVFNYSQRLLYQHKTLIWGATDSTSCNNFSKRLDSLHFTNTCIINVQGDSFQTNYRCMSLDQQIMTFNKFAKDVYLTLLYAQNNSTSTDDPDDLNEAFLNVLNGFEAINLHYLGITYLLPKLEAAQEILDEGINLKIDQLSQYSLIIALCTLAAELILFLIDLIVINGLKDEYNVVKILIARLPPISVVKTPSLVELITGKSEIKQSKKLTPIVVHLRFCSNSIIAFDKQCKIQLSNIAASETFGFTKEQLFRAHISTIISKNDSLLIQDKLNQNIESGKSKNSVNDAMKSNLENENNKKTSKLSSLLSGDENVDLNKDSGQRITNEKIDLFNDPCKMTIVGIKDDGNQIILSAILAYLPEPDDVYVLIMKDETKIYLNESEINKAKQRADDILVQILPRAISQNGRMKENISFSIKQVTVINIRIINFNESIPHLTSVQAIRNMSELFTLFDAQLMNYPNLTKTSVISDSFQAVGGLFNPGSIRKISSRVDDSNNLTINNDDINENENNNNNNNINNVKDSNSTNITNNENKNINAQNNNNTNSIIVDTNINNNESKVNNNNAVDLNANKISSSNSDDDIFNISSNNNSADNNANNINSNNNINNIDTENKEENNGNERQIKTKPSVRIKATSSKKTLNKDKVKNIRSRQSIYDIKSLNPEQSVQFSNIILDSIYFALNCITATEYVNASYGTNYVLGIGISSGGPITAGTLGQEHIQFEIVGGVLKESFLVSCVAEDGMIVITEDAYKCVIDSFEAQKNLLFDNYKKIETLHSKKIETYVVRPSDILCSQADNEVGISPMSSGGNDDDDDEIEMDEEGQDGDESFERQEYQQMLNPNDSTNSI